jgi:hypothetical protein
MKRLIAISVLLLSVAAAAQNLNFKTAPVQDCSVDGSLDQRDGAEHSVLKITVTNRSSVSVYYSPSAWFGHGRCDRLPAIAG